MVMISMCTQWIFQQRMYTCVCMHARMSMCACVCMCMRASACTLKLSHAYFRFTLATRYHRQQTVPAETGHYRRRRFDAGGEVPELHCGRCSRLYSARERVRGQLRYVLHCLRSSDDLCDLDIWSSYLKPQEHLTGFKPNKSIKTSNGPISLV